MMMDKETRSTFLKPLLAAFVSLLLLPVAFLLLYIGIARALESEVRLPLLFAIAAAGLAVACLLFVRSVRTVRSRFRTMITGMQSLLEGDRLALQRTMPVDAGDELGQLGDAFNELQQYIATQYADVERELKLAYGVQQNLLPAGGRNVAGFRFAAVCVQTKEVGGDFYDIVQLDETRAAVIVGDVAGKGMQAALLMSALLALFRREIRLGGTAAEVLERLNRLMFGALQGQLFITAGIAVFDSGLPEVEYASAGHMPPWVLAEGGAEETELSALPLGILPQTAYRNYRIAFPAGARFVLYTDGLVEGEDADGEAVGFARFARDLQELDAAEPLARQAERLMARTSSARDSRHADDRTVMLVARTDPGRSFR